MPPRDFDTLPRDLQMEVLRHTAARFVVTFNTVAELRDMRQHSPWIRMQPYLPVIVRCEFKLERRRASAPEMRARFTRAVDPAWKLTHEWLSFSAADQTIIERWARLVAKFESFHVLKVYDISDTNMLFCFLRRKPLMPRMIVEVAPSWSRFPRSVLADVREKMETVFHLPLGSM